jgi:hypothetical protein
MVKSVNEHHSSNNPLLKFLCNNNNYNDLHSYSKFSAVKGEGLIVLQ